MPVRVLVHCSRGAVTTKASQLDQYGTTFRYHETEVCQSMYGSSDIIGNQFKYQLCSLVAVTVPRVTRTNCMSQKSVMSLQTQGVSYVH